MESNRAKYYNMKADFKTSQEYIDLLLLKPTTPIKEWKLKEKNLYLKWKKETYVSEDNFARRIATERHRQYKMRNRSKLNENRRDYEKRKKMKDQAEMIEALKSLRE